MDLTIVRRRGLGHGSARGIIQTLEGMGFRANQWRTDRLPPTEVSPIVLRWGCSANIPWRTEQVLNHARAMHRVNDKIAFAQLMAERGLGPEVFTTLDELFGDRQLVVRPRVHSRGRNLAVCEAHSVSEVVSQPEYAGGWYARPLVQKTAEYRVYVVAGRVASVAQKIVSDTSAVAWNHALGAEFINVRFGSWPLDVVDRAVQAANISGLFYAAVDMMVGDDGQSWVIEINSAGSLPPNEDGSPSYRARCVARAIGYHLQDNDFSSLSLREEQEGWRKFIHPGIRQNQPVFRTIRNR